MSRQDQVHEKLGPCWCGSACHHGGFHEDPSDLRFDDGARRAFCKRTGEWVPGAYSEQSPMGRKLYERGLTLHKRRTYANRYPDRPKTTKGKRGYRWLILRDGRRVQVAVESNPRNRRGGSNSRGEDTTKTRRDRLVERPAAPAAKRSRRGVVQASTSRARTFLGLAKRDSQGNYHDPATGRFTRKG